MSSASGASGSSRHTASLGVLGGGQLGRMLALAGTPLGVRFRFLDPDPHAPAGDVGELITGSFDDPDALKRFADGMDAITFEFENVPAATVRWLAEHRPGSVFPSASALAVAQDRLEEKRAFERSGLEVPPYRAVSSADELLIAIRSGIGLPCVLKTRRMGYDGKGQAVISAESDAAAAFECVAEHLRPGAKPGGGHGLELLVESFVPFEREVSLICVRGGAGNDADRTRVYPLTENTHARGILRTSISPARSLPPEVEFEARAMADRLLHQLDYRGVLALELFLVHDAATGRTRLLGNEMAPRVHNSGHWTMDGCPAGQFENHVRAVLGWPLGDVAPHAPPPAGPDTHWGMANLIGGPLPDLATLAPEPWMRVHLYGKSARPGRKIGHVNLFASGRAELLERIGRVRSLIACASADS